MPVVKNLMVRVGANTSSFTSEMRKAAQGTQDFGTMVQNTMGGKVAESMKAFDADYIGDKIKVVKKQLKELMQKKDNWALQPKSLDPERQKEYQELAVNIQGVREELEDLYAQQAAVSSGGVSLLVEEMRELGHSSEELDAWVTGLNSMVDASAPLGSQLDAAKNALSEMEKAGLNAGDKAWDEMYAKVTQLTDAVKAYKAEIADGVRADLDVDEVDTSGIDDLVAHIREVEAAYDACGNIFKKLGMLKDLKQSNATISAMYAPDSSANIGQQLAEAKASLKEMENAGLGAGDAAWDDMYVQVQNLTRAVKEYKAALESVPVSVWSRMGSAAKSAFSKISTVGRGVKKVLHGVGTAVKGVTGFLGKIGGAGISGIKKVASFIGNIGSRAKSSSGGISSLGSVIKKVGVAAVGLKLASAMFGRLRSIVSEYIGENSALQAQVDALKNSMGQALAPAINLVANALSAVMPYIVGVSNAIGSLIANIFGTGWTTVASGAKAAAAATSGATAAQEEYNRSLAGFDEITKLESSQSSGGGGGGGSSGSSDVSSSTISGVLPDWLTDFASKIKDAVAAGDFLEVGKVIADQLGVAVEYASDLINSPEFRQKILGIVSAVTAGINGFFAELTAKDDTKSSIAENIGTLIGDAVTFALATIDRFFTNVDFGNIGVALAQGINGIVASMNDSSFSFGSVLGKMIQSGIDGAAGIINTLDWAGLGNLLAKNVSGFMNSIDWAGAGATLSNGVRGALNTITTAIQNVDWYQMGESIKDFLVNIDWKGVVSDLSRALGAALGGLGAIIGGLIGDAVANAKTYWKSKVEEAGGNVFKGILNGIIDGCKNIGTWIKNNIFNPLIEGFKSTFKIHSPSKDESILSIGKNIILGLLNGILEPIKNIKEWVQENIRDPIANALENVFGDNFISKLLKGGSDGKVTQNVEVKAVATSFADRTSKNKTTEVKAEAEDFVDKTGSDKTTEMTAKITSVDDSQISAQSAAVRTGVAVAVSLTKQGWISIASYVGTAVTAKVKLSKNGWTTISGYVGSLVTTSVRLAKSGWTTISGYIGTSVTARVALAKNGWSSLAGYVGSSVSAGVRLTKSGWTSLASFVGTAVSVTVSLKKGWTSSIKSLLGIYDQTIKLDVKTPTITIKWASFTAYGKTNWYPRSFNVNWYANGGIIDTATLLGFTGSTAHIAGEAGREAILPLDRNTGWMDKIAQRVVDRMGGEKTDRPVEITVQVPLDGKVIGQTVVRWANGQARATGTHPMAAYI